NRARTGRSQAARTWTTVPVTASTVVEPSGRSCGGRPVDAGNCNWIWGDGRPSRGTSTGGASTVGACQPETASINTAKVATPRPTPNNTQNARKAKRNARG